MYYTWAGNNKELKTYFQILKEEIIKDNRDIRYPFASFIERENQSDLCLLSSGKKSAITKYSQAIYSNNNWTFPFIIL